MIENLDLAAKASNGPTRCFTDALWEVVYLRQKLRRFASFLAEVMCSKPALSSCTNVFSTRTKGHNIWFGNHIDDD
jgi:hypothetical protein